MGRLSETSAMVSKMTFDEAAGTPARYLSHCQRADDPNARLRPPALAGRCTDRLTYHDESGR